MDDYGRQTLRRALTGLGAEVRFGDAMRETLEMDGFELTHARRAAQGKWLLRAKPPQEIQEGFGLAPEILLVAVQGEVQGRDLQRAADEVMSSGLRLDSNLLVVTDDKPLPLQERLDRLPGRGQRVAWVWGDDEKWPLLSEVLRSSLPIYDVFDEYDAVRGNQLMGRKAEVAELTTRVARGDAVGVFGLRKMGKTSLVRAVTDWLDPVGAMEGTINPSARSEWQVLWVDAEVLAPDATADDVADELLAALRRRARAAGARYEPTQRRGIPALKGACESLLDAGERLCFVIDEYDFLFEREGARGAVRGLSYLLRLLRGWAQQRQGAVSLILIGRDPEHLGTPQIDGVTNPLLAWFKPMWLGPLVPPHDTDLLRRLGRRVGLEVGDETAGLARHWTGGHPMLHRQFGSALRQEARVRSPNAGFLVPTDPYCAGAVERFCQRKHVHLVEREIYSLLKKRYPDAYTLLLKLVSASGMNLAAPTGHETLAIETLSNFGILNDSTHSVPQHLVWYAQTLLSEEPRSLHNRRRRRRSPGRKAAGAT